MMEEKDDVADNRPEGVLSSDSSANIKLEPQGPPNGGLKAWLQILGAFFLYFNTWGIVSSYGTYERHYEDSYLRKGGSFELSTIGSVQAFMMVFLGFIAGPIFDKGYFPHLLRFGTLMILLGTITQAFSKSYWELLLSQGLCVGIGMGCLAVPALAIPPAWFTTKMPIANGIVVSAGGFGGVIYPIMIRCLIPEVGFKWTCLCVALIILITLGISNIVLRTPAGPRPKRSFLDRTAFTDVPYVLFVLGCVFTFLGLYTTFLHIAAYATQEHITNSKVASFLVAIMNGASVFGRILPNVPAITNRLGPLNMETVGVTSLAIIVFCWNAGPNFAGLIIMSLIYGFFVGIFFTLQAPIYARLTANKHLIATRVGMASTVTSIGLLIGAPAGGVLITKHGFSAGWAWSGACLITGAALMATSRGLASKWRLFASV